MAESKNTGKKPGRPKKTPVVEEAKEEVVFFDVPEEQTVNTAEKAELAEENVLTVNADDVTGISYDGSETPLTELASELKGEEVEVPEKTIVHEEPETPQAEPTFTMADVQKMVAEAVAKATAEIQAKTTTVPQIVQVANDTEMVQFLWQAEVSADNTIAFGEGGIYGQITGKTGSFYVPKRDLSRVLSELNRYFLKKRWLIVVSGLNEEEREALGVNYKEGEILDKKAFAKMVELGDQMLEIYPNLCGGHKKMVAQRYADAYHEGSPYVTRDIVVKLNEMSKTAKNQKGDFIAIIEEMNARDAQ
mgnify:FL=1